MRRLDLSEDSKDKKEDQIYDLSESAAENSVDLQAQEQESEELAAAKEQVQRLEKDLLYLRAEFENFRRQSIKERSELLKYAGERLARDLLNVLDIFDSALSLEVNSDNWQEFKKGMELTQAELTNIFNKHGITEETTKEFDPRIHEAIGSEPSTEVEPGHVLRFLKKPYRFHDRVLRVGQVIVAKEPEKSSQTGEEN
jgi:molecular chaperone GrpE